MAALKTIGALAAIATLGSTFTLVSYAQGASAQTPGMERRSDRRGTRHDSRSAKHACNSAEGKSRADCRHMKRNVKQEGRQDRAKSTGN